MCLRKKKKVVDIVAEDRKLIANNSETIGKLVSLVNGNDELVAKLNDLKEKLKYLMPVNTKAAMDVDKKIGNKIADIKIELSRGYISYKLDGLISDILLLLVDRSV